MPSRASVSLALVFFSIGCSGSGTASPSPVAPPAATVAAPSPTPRPLPAWIDPALLPMLTVTPDGWVQRWEGGPMHHCLGPGVDRDVVGGAIAEMVAVSGIPTTAAGPCNVDWVRAPGVGHSVTDIGGTARSITYARVTLYHDDVAIAHHEGGHVLGLNHSPRPQDLMNATPRVETFSPEERAVLAWIYDR